MALRALRSAVMGAAFWAATLAPAQADTVAEIRSELNALSSVVAELARELSTGQAAEQPGFDGSVIDRVEQIRAELARLIGRTEELEFRIRRVIDEASNRLGDLEFRLTELEGGDPTQLPERPLGGEISAPPATTDTPEGTPELAAGEQQAFDNARALAEAGDADEAAEALDEFLAFYPGSPLGTEASLLLAEMHRARGAEAEAARAYLNLYLADPEGSTAPRALLALGDSLGRLEQREEACVMFDELRDSFPGSEEAREAEGARGALGCP